MHVYITLSHIDPRPVSRAWQGWQHPRPLCHATTVRLLACSSAPQQPHRDEPDDAVTPDEDSLFDDGHKVTDYTEQEPHTHQKSMLGVKRVERERLAHHPHPHR